MPVARNVWQHVEGGSPAAAARRLIIASTSRRSSARPVSRRPAGSTVWKSAAFGSSSPPASTQASRAAATRWWAGTSCRFPPFPWSLNHPRLLCPSRSPASAPVSIVSRSFLASAGESTGVAPLVTTCFGPRTEPVAEHSDRGQVLLHGRGRPGVGPDVGGHMERRDVPQPEASRLAPPQELPDGPPVRRPSPRVRDPPREALQEPRCGLGPRVDDHLRQDDPSPARRDRRLPGRRHQSLGRHSVTTSPPPARLSSSTRSPLVADELGPEDLHS